MFYKFHLNQSRSSSSSSSNNGGGTARGGGESCTQKKKQQQQPLNENLAYAAHKMVPNKMTPISLAE